MKSKSLIVHSTNCYNLINVVFHTYLYFDKYLRVLLGCCVNVIQVKVTRYIKGEDEDGVCKFKGQIQERA